MNNFKIILVGVVITIALSGMFYHVYFLSTTTDVPDTIENSSRVHLDVPHGLQDAQPACAYLATHNILDFYGEEISLEDFFGISGYYSSFGEVHYGLGWEKYHGKLYMILGKVLPELGYISYFSQHIQLENYDDKELPIKESLDNEIPLYFHLSHENYWYLDAVRFLDVENSIVGDFDSLDVFEKFSPSHGVAIIGYKYVDDDLLLEISDSAFNSPEKDYYYMNLNNYLDFVEYVRKNENRRVSHEDPLVANTLITKITKDPNNRFKLNEPDRSLHILYRIIDSLHISAAHLEGKIFNEKTWGKGSAVGCDMIKLMPKLADTLERQININDLRLQKSISILRNIPQVLGTCEKLSNLSFDTQGLTEKISVAKDRIYEANKLLSKLVNEKGHELKIKKNGNNITVTIDPKVENIYETNLRIGKGILKTDIDISNINLSSGSYEIVNDNIIVITNATYPLTVSLNFNLNEQIPLLFSLELKPDLKEQGIYHESGYTIILAQTIGIKG